MPAIQISTPPGFSFDRTVRSHGWFDLAPFSYDREASTLAFAYARASAVVSVVVRAGARGLSATVSGDAAARRDAAAVVRAVFRLDEDLAAARAAFATAPDLVAAIDAGGGRLLRAPTVFEDVVKMLCTTNCSWGLTRVMVERLVARAGAPGAGGVRAFPTAEALARRPVSFFRDVVRSGYRAPFFKELATRVARGDLELESLRDPGMPDDVAAERLRTIKGIGPYAADNLLRLLGHYDYLGLDSWCRARFKKLYPRARKMTGKALDAAIARRYRAHAPYRGLAMWLDLTRKWHDEVAAKAADDFTP
ncbi:MAG TPA: Fe-S cluster assembly protein HesB [Polyangia bacterium]|nr:Fe-S cluster assembly protein HesB [Polyangia bacterium]